MPVLHQTVGLGAFHPLDEKIGLVDLPARAADTAQAVYDDVLALHQPVVQGNERHEDARRVAARRGDDLRLRLPCRGRQFRKDITRACEQFRRMVLAVVTS